MAHRTSLFARKLRAWRACNGVHGRMTQEGLAEKLGVSVDAVGKYERSVSFIRGDLEHRLIDRLGWSRGDIQTCREDWEARQKTPGEGAYRLLDDALVHQLFEGSWTQAIHAMIEMADTELGALPAEFASSQAVFMPVYDAYRTHWAAVMHNGEIIAKWALPFLLPEDEAHFKAGKFIESDLSVDRTHRPILPGTYYGYCTAVIIKPGHEAAGPVLLSSFVRFLEDLAARDILLHGIGTVACSAGGTQMCRDLGMTHLGNHRAIPDFGIWDMPGAAIANSIFGRRSPTLRTLYSETFQT